AIWLIPVSAKHAFAHRERTFHPEPAGTRIPALGRADSLAPVARGPQDCLRGGLAGPLAQHRIDQDVRQDVWPTFRDAHPHVFIDGHVDLRRAPDFAHAARRWVIPAQQSCGDKLVEMEGGELARDADGRRRLLACDRPTSRPDEVMYPAPQL